MSIITFWTEIEKEIGQTSSAIAVATQMAMEHNSKILLLTTYNRNEIRNAFWKKEEEERKKNLFSSLSKQAATQVGFNNGMEGIMMEISSNRLMADHITNYTKIIFKNRLEVLAGANVSENEYRKEVFGAYIELIKKASQYYDYVIVDLNKEMNPIVEELLNISTIIAYGINQKNGNLEKFTNSLRNGFLQNKFNIVPYIGRYDKFSKYSQKNISRTTKVKRIEIVPYNTLFAESCDEGVAAEYFMKMSTVTGVDRNVEFIADVKKFVEALLYKEQELKMNHGRK